MDIEDQVCSLELAQKLKEFGIKQEGFFYYVRCGINVNTGEEKYSLDILSHNLESIPSYYISAFTVAELGEILPEEYISCKTKGQKLPSIEYKKYWLCYYDPDGCDSDVVQMEETEADARAKVLIYLLENKLMEL